MKKLFKRLVLKVTFLSDLILDKGIGTKVRLATLAGNFIVNFYSAKILVIQSSPISNRQLLLVKS